MIAATDIGQGVVLFVLIQSGYLLAAIGGNSWAGDLASEEMNMPSCCDCGKSSFGCAGGQQIRTIHVERRQRGDIDYWIAWADYLKNREYTAFGVTRLHAVAAVVEVILRDPRVCLANSVGIDTNAGQ